MLKRIQLDNGLGSIEGQVMAVCEECHAGLMMVRDDGIIQCETCAHRHPVTLDGTPLEFVEPKLEDGDPWF